MTNCVVFYKPAIALQDDYRCH